ncbi:MAG: DNA-3-methyladenine glycosylase [Vicinamibacterales bacterium]
MPTPHGSRIPSGVRVLPRSFYGRPTLDVARDLLGKVLVREVEEGMTSGIIVETEAYIGEDDPACHAARGPTVRNAPLYGPPGFAYVYLNYGIHYLVNAVTEADGHPSAVLIRALEPLDGVRMMHARRAPVFTSRLRRGGPEGRELLDVELCRGPGNLSRALDITLLENQRDLCLGKIQGESPSRLWVEDRGVAVGTVEWGPRIGIRVGTERPWRCWVAGHPCVSNSRSAAKVAGPTRQ